MTGAKFDQTVAKLIVRAVGMLGCLFVALKLAGYITWSWVWVLVPFWMWAVPLRSPLRRHAINGFANRERTLSARLDR